MKQFFLTMSFVFGLALLLSCNTACGTEKITSSSFEKTLCLVNWNVETFFDSVTDGNEYDEYKSSDWGHDAYVERLKRLASVIRALDADIFVMEELENEGVLFDLYNFLSDEWNSKKIYQYACFAKDANSSIGCGLLSRYPLRDMSVHALDVRTEAESMPSMRPLLQVSVDTDGKVVQLLVSHWKSMLGGEEKTELWRNWQESVLYSAFERNGTEQAVVACGDYNRDVSHFAEGSKKSCVRLRSALSDKSLDVVTGWNGPNGSTVQPGSYYYDGWSRIDNFFTGGTARIVSFAPATDGPWCDSESKIPLGYKIWSGKGYSDHLPVRCVIAY